MNAINTFIPTDSLESFKKFAVKTKKNVEGFNIELGKPYQKLFRHFVKTECQLKEEKRFHEVCDCTITMPDESDWRLLSTYKDGAFTPADPSKKLVYKNPSHGSDYGKCDLCGHWCQNSYVIINTKTGEELQVGCECIKKFGLKHIDYLSQFTRELYKVYDYRISYATDEEYGDVEPIWGGSKDSSWKQAILKTDLIMAAKVQYDILPIWKKGYYIGRDYFRSPTAENIENILNKKKFNVDEEYVKKACDFALSKDAKSEFEGEMQKVANYYYTFKEHIVYAFFLVNNYEDSLKDVTKGLSKGMQVKVVGKVIQHRTEESYYGLMETNTILTSTGVICERIGKIPTSQKDGVTITEFYAIIKGIFNGKVSLDRATKNPKKGKEVIEI